MEALWMLAGRDDLTWPLYFNSRFKDFSDDGVYVHGAYGYRWRHAMGFDQLKVIAEELKKNSESRRCVLQMWDATNNSFDDLHKAMTGGRDVPCNVFGMFDARGGKLNLTVCVRSHDALWGAFGANVVHFSVLLEYVAAMVGIPVGVYRTFSNNFHVYVDVIGGREGLLRLAADAEAHDDYTNEDLQPLPLVSTSIEDWDRDLYEFMFRPGDPVHVYKDNFFNHVARPMYLAWSLRKSKHGTGLKEAQQILAPDWRKACVEWIERREAKKALKETA
jgi:hypothetical protein